MLGSPDGPRQLALQAAEDDDGRVLQLVQDLRAARQMDTMRATGGASLLRPDLYLPQQDGNGSNGGNTDQSLAGAADRQRDNDLAGRYNGLLLLLGFKGYCTHCPCTRNTITFLSHSATSISCMLVLTRNGIGLLV